HAVITGVALLGPGDTRQIASETTYVTMRPMTDEEIDEYITSGEWRDKAGAYAIQETADQFIRTVDGSFSNVVGLPMELLGQMMTHLDEISG
ncbi:MAG: Maf family protein, partial [Phycisphaerae bacterium]|nr:Maf family protein [Phycisphaerae bacterium]